MHVKEKNKVLTEVISSNPRSTLEEGDNVLTVGYVIYVQGSKFSYTFRGQVFHT